MTSPTLLGGSAPSSPTGGTGAGSSTARTNSAGGNRRDFDALLNGNKDTPRPTAGADKPKAKSPDSANGATQDNTARPKPDGPRNSASKPSTDDSTAPAPATAADASKPTDETDATDPTTEAVAWPPLGLAGLALSGLAPPAADGTAAAVRALTGSTPGVAANTNTLPTVTPSAPTATGPALAAPAATAAGNAGEPGPIALPLDAEVSDELALPNALADAIASSSADGDAPTTPFLHALQTAADLKSPAATAPFSGSPTATPHVGGEDFDEAMSARIGWLADQKIGHATIKVTPHDLGLIEVRLQMDGDKVHASFTSAHADVRHALESTLPRLRELLNDQGFQLGNADVGHQHTAQDGKDGSGQGERGGGVGGNHDSGSVETTVSTAQLMRQRGLVDAYA
ncbi:flagellar hook-length control protein FliK [Stenotrophomonas sp. GZD-301]|uniref:flagellar hook-length control protein FliK n=1 Tax=Stenotrophomonas sp. GZD-301 TaxID=3404814 RepID=UPI003BB74CCE